MLVSTVESDDLAFFTNFAGAVPEATITAETDESITPPKPVETELSETDKLVDLADERVQGFLRSWTKRGLPMPLVGSSRRSISRSRRSPWRRTRSSGP